MHLFRRRSHETAAEDSASMAKFVFGKSGGSDLYNLARLHVYEAMAALSDLAPLIPPRAMLAYAAEQPAESRRGDCPRPKGL